MQRFTFDMGHHQQQCCIHLSENSLDWSLVQALPELHAFSGCNTTSCYKGKGTLENYIFSETRFTCYFKFGATKKVLTDKNHFQSKIENISSYVHSVS